LLHPPLLEEMGLVSAVPWYVDEFSRRSGVAVNLDLPNDMERLPKTVELTIFRVLQETLTNIHRHSGSKTAEIKLRSDGKMVSLTVEDHGKGFDSRTDRLQKSGIGIASMRERVQEQGGELQINSKPTGTIICVVLTVDEAKCPVESSS
jgi:two-component system NarL family sensor kinase